MTSATGTAICRRLAECNGGPGLTCDELSKAVGVTRPFVRQELAQLVFREHAVTCDRAGRYRLGDPTPLLECA